MIMSQIEFNDLVIEKLEDHHDISCFECGNPDLNEFLIEKSRDQMNNKVNVTYLCKYDSYLVAFFTWCADSIMLKKIIDKDKEYLEELGINYETLPALKLCRLAVDKQYHGNRIGPELVELVISTALELSKTIGLRFITVDAYCNARWLYDKYLFEMFPKEERKLVKYKRNPRPEHTISMYLDIHKE